MKRIFKVDGEGYLVFGGDIAINPSGYGDNGQPTYSIPEGFVEPPLPTDTQGNQLPFYKPKWNGSAWIEGMSEEEIEKLVNSPKEPSDIEKLRLEQAQANAELVQLIMMMGGA